MQTRPAAAEARVDSSSQRSAVEHEQSIIDNSMQLYASYKHKDYRREQYRYSGGFKTWSRLEEPPKPNERKMLAPVVHRLPPDFQFNTSDN